MMIITMTNIRKRFLFNIAYRSNYKKLLISIRFLTLAFFLVSTPAISAKKYSHSEKKYIEYFQKYYLDAWQKPELKISNNALYKTLREHRKSYSAFSKIDVIDIKRVNRKTKKIHYYYKSWFKGVYPQPYWATVTKVSGPAKYKILSVDKSSFELNDMLEKKFKRNYKKFKKLFIEKKLKSFISLKDASELVVTSSRAINDIYLNPVHYNAISESGSEFYALYSIQYEKGVIGYLMHTPQCYGVPESGLVLFVINENKLEFNIFKDKNYFRSRILIREPQCDDGKERWNTKGYFVDINNDGYLDIVTRYQFKKQKNSRRLRPRTKYYKYTYRGNGRYRFSRLSRRSFRKIIRRLKRK